MTLPVRRGAAVLGSPISHSLSPVLHETAYAELGLPDWRYRAVECSEEQLPSVLNALESEGLAGASLTMPLKRAVLPLLTRTDRVVADVGAANTVLFGGVVGEWWGGNTDVPGMVAALMRAGVSRVSGAVVLGGGATALAALAALNELGGDGVTAFVRRPPQAAALADLGRLLGMSVRVQPWSAAAESLSAAPLVIATTPAGATDELAATVSLPAGVLFDVVYAPWPTALARAWTAAGGAVVGGLELLVAQAALQVELMTGRQAPIEAMRAAGLAALR